MSALNIQRYKRSETENLVWDESLATQASNKAINIKDNGLSVGNERENVFKVSESSAQNCEQAVRNW